MKKPLVLLIGFIFIFVFTFILMGCDSKGTESSLNTETDTKTGIYNSSNAHGGETVTEVEPLILPIVNPPGSVTLTWGTCDNWYAPASYTQNLEIFQTIEKDTGVKIIWDVVPLSQYKITMETRLAAATDLPDFINVPGGNVVKYASYGLLIPIDDLINKYAPNILRYFEADPLIKKVLTAPDGHIYNLASVVTGTVVSDPYAWIVRKDWLDRMELIKFKISYHVNLDIVLIQVSY